MHTFLQKKESRNHCLHVTPVMAVHTFCDWLKIAHCLEVTCLSRSLAPFPQSCPYPSLFRLIPLGPRASSSYMSRYTEHATTTTITVSFWDRWEAFVLNKPIPMRSTRPYRCSTKKSPVATGTSPRRFFSMPISDDSGLQCERCSLKLHFEVGRMFAQRTRSPSEAHER